MIMNDCEKKKQKEKRMAKAISLEFRLCRNRFAVVGVVVVFLLSPFTSVDLFCDEECGQ
jgi:hypothetical protein